MDYINVNHRALVVLRIYAEAYEAIRRGAPAKLPAQRDVIDLIMAHRWDCPHKLRKKVPLGEGAAARTKIVRAEHVLKESLLIRRDRGQPVEVTDIGMRVIKALRSAAWAGDNVENWPTHIEVRLGFDSVLYQLDPSDPSGLVLETKEIPPVLMVPEKEPEEFELSALFTGGDVEE